MPAPSGSSSDPPPHDDPRGERSPLKTRRVVVPRRINRNRTTGIRVRLLCSSGLSMPSRAAEAGGGLADPACLVMRAACAQRHHPPARHHVQRDHAPAAIFGPPSTLTAPLREEPCPSRQSATQQRPTPLAGPPRCGRARRAPRRHHRDRSRSPPDAARHATHPPAVTDPNPSTPRWLRTNGCHHRPLLREQSWGTQVPSNVRPLRSDAVPTFYAEGVAAKRHPSSAQSGQSARCGHSGPTMSGRFRTVTRGAPIDVDHPRVPSLNTPGGTSQQRV